MAKDRFLRVCWALAFLALAVPLALRFLVLVRTPVARLPDVVDFIFDDGYYYFAMAANLADTGRSTLDGLTATNGYQPLWFVVLAAFARVVGTRPFGLFVAGCGLIYAIAAAAPLLAIIWRRSVLRSAALCMAAGLAVIVIQQPEIFLEGLEPILFVPLALPLVLLIEDAADSGRVLGLSLVLAAAFLVRLDALALYGAALLVLPVARFGLRALGSPAGRAQWMRMGLRLSLFVVPTVVVYLLLNRALFGTAVPVSGVAKMISGALFNNWGVAAEFLSRWKSLLFLLVILLPLEVLARAFDRADRTFYRPAVIIAIAAAIQCLYYCAFSTWHVWPWYAYLVALEMAVITARIVHLAARLASVPRAQFVAVGAVGVLGAWALYRADLYVAGSFPRAAPAGATARVQRSFNQVSLEMLDRFFAGRPHTVIGMGDRAGGLAYWGRAGLAVVQTEGLTLDMDYIRARLAGRTTDYLEQRYPIEYLVVDREFIPTVAAPDGTTLSVVAEPIQGPITSSPVPTFCFPADAVRYEQPYVSEFGTNRRVAFDFARRVSCPAAAFELVTAAARAPGGLRRFSLPSEYRTKPLASEHGAPGANGNSD